MALKPEQMQAIEYLSLPRKMRKTEQEFCEEIGISRQTLWKWKNNPEFNEELKANIANTILPHVPGIIEKMVESANGYKGSAPSAKAAELLFKTAGLLKNVTEYKNTSDKPKDIDRDAIKRRLEELKARNNEEQSPH